MMLLRSKVATLIFVVVLVAIVSKASSSFFKPFNVTYDSRALILDGQRRILISAGIHYPRSTPEMWPDLIQKSKDGGVDLIETYVFWNGHEPLKGQYNFDGRYDIVKFIKLVASSGLYLHLRIGPYVCAEWNFGGFPVWLRSVPGVQFRTNNEPFKAEMQRFVKKIVDLMKEELLFSWQGGPIILLQIENEYGDAEGHYGQSGKEYVEWAAKMALGLDAGVPWVMCKQTDAPEDIIDTCNGYYCDNFKPNSHKKPILWTEDWDGWYAKWGESLPHRPAEDLAFAVARFYERGGSFQNYYMYFGGTNFGRTSGGPFYITSYDYDAPIDEYGLVSEPKWGHLKNLHAAVKLCESALVKVDDARYMELGSKQEAHIYNSSTGICCAFLANIDDKNAKTVNFHGVNYNLPPWSVSILPDCRTVVYNTAKVTVQSSVKTADPVPTPGLMTSPKISSESSASFLTLWEAFKEPIGIWSEKNFSVSELMEQLQVTEDKSDYLWHVTKIQVSEEDIDFWEKNTVRPAVAIDFMRDVLHVFVNDQLSGTTFGDWVKVNQPVNFTKGLNQLTLLSETVGLQNYGPVLEADGGGFRGLTKLMGFKNGNINLSELTWTYQVGLLGENKRFFSPDECDRADWNRLDSDAQPTTFTWYKSYFDAPKGLDPVALDLGSMGKGQAWVNGHHLGRYWTLQSPKQGCYPCDYRGTYNKYKCRTNCGMPTQSLYHIPRSWLRPTKNLLVVFEETGGNPFEISVKVRASRVICGDVSESDYPPLNGMSKGPMVQLRCEEGRLISAVDFASYGKPRGSCQHFSVGACHFANSTSVVSHACLGRNECQIAVSNAVFGDPCPRVVKSLAVQVKCDSFAVAGSAIY